MDEETPISNTIMADPPSRTGSNPDAPNRWEILMDSGALHFVVLVGLCFVILILNATVGGAAIP